MYYSIVSTLLFATVAFGEDLMNMPMPSFGGSTLPPPFGLSGQFPPQQNNMMFQQQPPQFQPQQSGYPMMNPPPSFNGMNGMPINSGPQMAQLAGFTNGFADMMGMSPSPMRGFPGNPPDQFNAIDSATTAPVIVKKRQVFPPNGGINGGINGQQNGIFGQPGAMGQQQQPGINGQPNSMGQFNGMGQPGSMGQMNGGQQPLGPAGIPIVGSSQGNFQNPSQSQPFGSFQSGSNSFPQNQQQPGGMNSLQG